MRRLADRYGRLHDYLRISVTDKSNLNCMYCGTEGSEKRLLRKRDKLSNEETFRLIRLFVEQFGFKKVRFAGGEPLVRRDMFELLENLRDLKVKSDFKIALTTNGTVLFDKLAKLKHNGVSLININLDTLNSKKFHKINGKDKFQDVINSVEVAINYGFENIKINCLVIRGINDDEIPHFAAFAYLKNINVRFIEYSSYRSNLRNDREFIPVHEIKDIIEREHNIRLIDESRNEVCENYSIHGSRGTLSFISSVSYNFCDSCNRIRITSDGHLKLCLFSNRSSDLNLKPLLRDKKYTDNDICRIMEGIIRIKKLQPPPVEEIINLKTTNKIAFGN